jgi:hypothetical protein
MALRWAQIAAALVMSLLCASRALAAPAAQVGESTTYVLLAPYLDVLEDPTARLALDDVQSPEVAARFAPFAGRMGPGYAYTKSAVWMRFTVENASDRPLERWLVVGTPLANVVDVFRDGEPPAHRAENPRDAELSRPWYTFRLLLAPHQRRVVYVRAAGEGELRIAPELWEIAALSGQDRLYARVSGVALGVMAALALYNAFLFLYVRQRAHLLYAGYLVAIGVWCTCVDGTLLDVLPVHRLPHQVNTMAVYSAFAFAGLFMRDILGLPAARPRLDRFVLATVGVMLFIAGAHFVGAIDYRTLNVFGRLGFYPSILGWIVVAVIRWRDRLSAARYVVFGWTAMLSISLFGQLALFGDLPRWSWLTPPAVAFAVEAVLLSLALADAARSRDDVIVRLERARVTELESRNREVAQLNDELRRQVAERSRELTAALARAQGGFAPTSALAIGEVFHGRYRVARALGSGGMGAVYEVERTSDGRRLALKVVTGPIGGVEAARFFREAEIGASIRHPNLVSIVDVGIATDAPYLVMELVEGGSMEDHRRRFGDVAWALPILRQVAAGLAALHDHQIVHRDLKPGNVLLVEPGDGRAPVAKISDFGISRRGAPDPDGVDPQVAPTQKSTLEERQVALTESGGILGTPLYMPPEALYAAALRPSADVFSFGLLAYEALSGRAPFKTLPGLAATSATHRPSSLEGEGVSTEIARLVLACLSSDPADRPRARELAEAMAKGVEGGEAYGG